MDEKRIYWSISQAAEILGIEPSILRYWEKEFDILQPVKNRGGNRSYQKKDIDIANKIKYLLYKENFTIKGAIKKMKKLKSIPLENYIKLQNLVFNKEFLQDFENFSEILSKLVESSKL
ncbi:MAG: MerR family transcriptional regulator [Chitinispirillales bacterium]|jgi:DNA-binding transcriptional MerR regulator|nr:MerR family transcriptional regulator [Chitinispirillales bacterium]